MGLSHAASARPRRIATHEVGQAGLGEVELQLQEVDKLWRAAGLCEDAIRELARVLS